jgi:hypothetical protein
LILNFLAYTSGLQTNPLGYYIPRWKNWTVKISDFLENKDNQPLKPNNIMLAKRMHPTGFDIRTDNVLPSIYSKVITYCTELPKYAADKEKEGWELIGKTQKGFSILVR